VVSRRVILVLVAVAMVLLVTFAVTSALVFLLGELVDRDGVILAKQLAVACLVGLVVDLVCLLLAVGVRASESPDDREPPALP
jgi:hypothetical protein